MEKLEHSVALLLAAITLVIVMLSIAVDQQQEKSELIKISFLDADQLISVYTDQDGIIQQADAKVWLDRIIINVSQLQAGDTLQCYDLYSDIIAPKEYKTINVER